MSQDKSFEKTFAALINAIDQEDLEGLRAWAVEQGDRARDFMRPIPRGEHAGITPLQLAAGGKTADLALLLLPLCDKQDAKAMGEALFIAAQKGNAVVAQALLPFCDPQFCRDGGKTALMASGRAPTDECARLLWPLSDPFAEDFMNTTAMGWASYPESERDAPIHFFIERYKALGALGQGAIDGALAQTLEDDDEHPDAEASRGAFLLACAASDEGLRAALKHSEEQGGSRQMRQAIAPENERRELEKAVQEAAFSSVSIGAQKRSPRI